jgi:putative oxidoreductase
MKETIASWEGYTRSLLRIILAFVFTLHGFRHSFGYFHVSGGRRAAVPMALDGLPSLFGGLEIAGGVLLFLGLFTRPVAAVLCAELLAAYFYSAVPRDVWPIRNGGNEVLLYFVAFLYFAVAGAGAWSLDHVLQKRRRKQSSAISATAPART